jgi:hypothetical protein
MLLQRLIADKDSGFNYDYMGSAEFEFGATSIAREALARLVMRKKLAARESRFFVKWGRTTHGPIDVYVFGLQKTLDDIGIAPLPGTKVPYDLLVTADKENARMDNDRILGWMSVRSDSPILILRRTEDNLDRGNKFLQMFINQILKEEPTDVYAELVDAGITERDIEAYIGGGGTLAQLREQAVSDGLIIASDAVSAEEDKSDNLFADRAKVQHPGRSEAFYKGWADASALKPRNNPYEEKTNNHRDYDYGYTMSMEDNA